MGHRRGTYRVLVVRQGKRPPVRPGRRWENIKMDPQKWDGAMDWMDLAEDRERWRALMATLMNLRVP